MDSNHADHESAARIGIAACLVAIFAGVIFFSAADPAIDFALAPPAGRVVSNRAVLPHDSSYADLSQAVHAIAWRVARSSDASTLDWHFEIVHSTRAFIHLRSPATVVISTGVLPVLENENALAIVLGHEIAHITAGHLRHASAQTMHSSEVAADGPASDVEPFSPQQEAEADYIGLIYAARACFDPSEAAWAWTQLDGAEARGVSTSFVSMHPVNDHRLMAFHDWVAAAINVWGNHCGHGEGLAMLGEDVRTISFQPYQQ